MTSTLIKDIILHGGKEMENTFDIKTARKEKGITQSELAKMLGCSVKTLQNWEQKRCKPSRIVEASILAILS